MVHLPAHLLLFVALLLLLYALHPRIPDTGYRIPHYHGGPSICRCFFLLRNLDHLFIHWFAGNMYADIRDSGINIVKDYFIGPRPLLNFFYIYGAL